MQNWKQYVIALCKIGTPMKSKDMAQVIRSNGFDVTEAQVRATRAHFSQGRY